MRGKVLDFSLQNGGLITAEDGQRYRFEPSEWKEQNMPVRGMLVDFDTNGQPKPMQFTYWPYPKPPQPRLEPLPLPISMCLQIERKQHS